MQHHGAWMCSLCNGTRWLPGPTDYRFNGNAFVFSLQATALNPKPGSTGMPDDDDYDAGGGGGDWEEYGGYTGFDDYDDYDDDDNDDHDDDDNNVWWYYFVMQLCVYA